MEGHRKRNSALLPYTPPDWAKSLTYLPKYRVELIQPNTPIHEWNIPGVPEGFSVHVKRDDLTGCTLSGNKCRPLEFLLADAIDTGCSHVITWASSALSNHCRTTALACAELGLTSHLLVVSDVKEPSELTCEGNLLLNRLCGTHMYLIPKQSFSIGSVILPRKEALAEFIKQKTGEDSYFIPVSGGNKVGIFGYISAFQELLSQGVQENFDDIVVTGGNRTTAAGLGIANFLTGSKLKIHCVDISEFIEVFRSSVEECFRDLGFGSIKLEDAIDIIDGHYGLGYELSTTEELEFIRDVCVKTGVVLDPVYTGKAALGLVKELKTNPHRFKGSRILFINTGGMFGFFDGRVDSLLQQDNSTSNRIKLWPNKDMDPSF